MVVYGDCWSKITLQAHANMGERKPAIDWHWTAQIFAPVPWSPVRRRLRNTLRRLQPDTRTPHQAGRNTSFSHRHPRASSVRQNAGGSAGQDEYIAAVCYEPHINRGPGRIILVPAMPIVRGRSRWHEHYTG
jgi:hypothetical protein